MDKKELTQEAVDAAAKISSGASKVLKDYIIDIAIVAIALVFVLRSVITIGQTGRTVSEILADGFMTLLFGFLVSRLLEAKGIFNGELSRDYRTTMLEYAKVIDVVTPYIDRLDDFCKGKNEAKLKEMRTKILLSAGIKYEVYADKDFDESKYSPEKQKIIAEANNAKLPEELSTRFLTSEDGKVLKKKEFGRTVSQYVKSSTRYDLISKVGICIAFSYFGVSLSTSFSWSVLVWYVIQIGLLIILGVWKYLNAYSFVVGEHRNRIIRKINLLYEFRNEEERKEKSHDAGKALQAAEQQ